MPYILGRILLLKVGNFVSEFIILPIYGYICELYKQYDLWHFLAYSVKNLKKRRSL